MGRAAMYNSDFIGSRQHTVAVLREVNRLIERDSPMLRPSEVAKRLGVSVRTVENMVKDGRLKAVNIGRQCGKATYRIRELDLESLLKPVVPVHRE